MANAPSPLALWIAAGGALLLWSLLLWAAWRRQGRERSLWPLLLHGLLLMGALVALYLIWSRPTYRKAGAETVIVLNGQAPTQLDSLLQVYPAATVYSLQPHEKFPLLEGLSYVPQRVPAGSRLFLVGEGLPASELAYLKPYPFTYLPGTPLQGVLELHYASRVLAGDSLRIAGRWHPAAVADRLVLSQGMLALDSAGGAPIKGGVQAFSLSAPVRFSGRQAYQLYWLGREGDTLAAYPLPVQAQSPPGLQLALLTAYPEPESKYLKEYLSQQGYRLYYAAQLAPGLLMEEWVNIPRQPLRFTQASLSDYDVLVLTTGFWAGLSAGQQQEIAEAVAQKGIGLLFYPDAETGSLRWQGQRLQLTEESFTDSVLLPGTPLALEYRRPAADPAGWIPLLRGQKGHALALQKRQGLGMLALSGSQRAYQLLLHGRTEAYQTYWNYLFSSVLPLPTDTDYLLQTEEASTGRSLQLRLHTSDSLPTLEVQDASGQPVPHSLWQLPGQKGVWQAVAWPSGSGWHSVASASDTLSVKVLPAPGSLQRHAWRQASLQASRPLAEGNTTIYRQELIPAGWFYVLFLISMGGLWLERKLRG